MLNLWGAKREIVYVGLFIFFCMGIVSILSGVYNSVLQSVHIRVNEDGLISETLFSENVELRFAEIDSVGFSRLNGYCIRIAGVAGQKVCLGMDFPELGELVEVILREAKYIRKVDLGNEPLKPQHWQKEPDWTIINSAIRRAENNCSVVSKKSSEH